MLESEVPPSARRKDSGSSRLDPNRPLTEVIDRICNLGNIRYEFKNGVLTFYNDYSFAKHYLVNYLAESSLWSDVQANLRNILKSVSKNNTSITLNKSAGIVTVFANQKGQKAIKSYLDKVKRISSSQVLLEAKVVEVSLSDEYSAGIDWSILDSNGNGTKVLGSEAASTFDEGNPAAAVFSVAGSSVFGGDGKMTISALEKFGEVKAVSSPRISTLHNRKAKLDFIDKLIYFTISTDSTTDTSGSSGTVVSESVSAEMHEEPVGVELSITPSIDLKNNEITLEVNPKLSINSGEVAKDPSVGSDGENLGNEIPIIQTREIKTFAKIKSGDTLVVGGLMKESVNNNETAVPFLSDIPFIGNLFKYVNKSTSMVETVIFIKATIVDSASGLNRFDQRFHNKFLKTRNNILK